MRGTPASICTPVSIDLVRDRLGTVPPVLEVCGVRVKTTRAPRNGRRPLWVCPSCCRTAVLLYVNAAGTPACRRCHRIIHPGSSPRDPRIGELAAALRGDSE